MARFILKHINRYRKCKILPLVFEDMIDNPQSIKKVCDFIGIDGTDIQFGKYNLSKNNKGDKVAHELEEKLVNMEGLVEFRRFEFKSLWMLQKAIFKSHVRSTDMYISSHHP